MRGGAGPAVGAVLVAGLLGCAAEPGGPQEPAAWPEAQATAATGLSGRAVRTALRMSPLPPVPADPTNAWSMDRDAAELGRALFHTRRLSKGDRISCATCHDHRDSFVDGKRLAEGVLPLERHSMTLWNVAHQRWFFWDGRADTLWSQALVPLEDPLEHAFARTEVARVIGGDPQLRGLYEVAFGELADFADETRFPPYARPVPDNDRAHELAVEHARRAAEGDERARPHHEHIGGSGFYHPHQRSWDAMTEADQDLVNRVFVNAGKALAAFQGRMRSDRSDFDVFVEGLRTGDPGKLAALGPAERRGFELFVGEARCVICHHGPLLSDLEFHDTRVPVVAGAPADDPGRTRGIQSLRASEFTSTSPWSDDPEGPAGDKVRYLPPPDAHAHGGTFEFKTPSLRNVALTAPYMHNGSLATLEDVVRFYVTREGERPSNVPGETILQPLDLSDEDQAALVAFLESLTDDSLDLDEVGPPR